jgi:uncharacterized surface protein with fasciclin (FAS1) repeats
MLGIHRIATAAAAALTLAAAQAARAQDRDIVETAIAAGSFTTLAKALTAAGLVETLKGAGPFTVFAPTDEAFAKLPPGALDKLLADRAQLRRVLLYHVVPGRVPAAEVVKLTSAKTAAGPSARVMVHGGTAMIDDANVVQTDVAASNGIIHVIDAVILPPAGNGAPVRKDGG